MGFILDIQIDNIEDDVDCAVYDMVVAHENRDEIMFRAALDRYELHRQKVRIGKRMQDHNLDQWDWKWAADTGHLCTRDWEWFGDDIIAAGVDKEAYDKKWKANLKGKLAE